MFRFRQVAIKIIDTRKIREEYVRTNLHREARIMASLRHPNIIRLYETLKVCIPLFVNFSRENYRIGTIKIVDKIVYSLSRMRDRPIHRVLYPYGKPVTRSSAIATMTGICRTIYHR